MMIWMTNRNRLLIPIILLFSQHLYADAVSIEFHSGPTNFQAEKSKNTFKFSDKWGPRSLKIEVCNTKIIDEFWTKLNKAVSKSGSRTVSSNTNAWVKYDGIKIYLFEFESSHKIFVQAADDVHLLFVESSKLCGR